MTIASSSGGVAFGYSVTNGGTFDGTVTVKADEIDINADGSVGVAATGVMGSISFEAGDLGHFTFSADTIAAHLGSYLELDTTGATFDSAPPSGGDFASFQNVTAKFTLPTTDPSTGKKAQVVGIGERFRDQGRRLDRDRDRFRASLTINDAGSLEWPTWLPVQVTSVGISWPSFATDPLSFSLTLSASANANNLFGTGLSLSGSVQNAVIDVGLLEQGQFPITSLDGFSFGVSGHLFGADISGQIDLGVLNTDDNGNVVTSGGTHHFLYGGVEAGIDLFGEAGFEVRVGFSEFGPLDAYLNVGVPIILDPESGLAITDLNAQIVFGSGIPSLTNAKDLQTQLSEAIPANQTASQWFTQLGGQVDNILQNRIADDPATAFDPSNFDFSALTKQITIGGGVTFFDAYASPDAFKLVGSILFDNLGHIEATGTITEGDEISETGGIYLDASQIAAGHAQVLFYAAIPQPGSTTSTPSNSLVAIYGGLGAPGRYRRLGPAQQPDDHHRRRGRPDPPRPAGRPPITGNAVFSVSHALTSLDLSLDGHGFARPARQPAPAQRQGPSRYPRRRPVLRHLRGRDGPALPAPAAGDQCRGDRRPAVQHTQGLDESTTATRRRPFIRAQASRPTPPAGRCRTTCRSSRSASWSTARPPSTATARTVRVTGTLDAVFSVTTDDQGVHPLLQVFVAGDLTIGPATNPYIDLGANGFLQISDAGMAAGRGPSLTWRARSALRR